MERKKIAILVKNLTSGGAEKQSVLLAKALMDRYQVHYIIFNGDVYESKYLDWLKEENLIHIVHLQGNKIRKFIALKKYLKNEHIDSLFSYLTAANFYGALAAKLAGTGKIYTGIRNARLPLIKLYIEKFLTNSLISQTIFNCFSGKEYFQKKGFNSEKMIVIPNCFDRITPFIERWENEIVYIITVGRFVPQKDYYTALKAIAELAKEVNNFRYQIIGIGYLESQIRQWVEELDLKSIVEIYINPDNIPELLAMSDIYLSTSLFEGTSNSIMEALNASLPVVATNVGDNNELVKNGQNGYLTDVQDYITIMEKLKKLISNIKLRNTMGFQSHEILQNNYSIENFKQKYINLIEKNEK